MPKGPKGEKRPADVFGDAAPGYGDRPIYGLFSSRTDRSIRERPNGPRWIAAAAARRPPRLGGRRG